MTRRHFFGLPTLALAAAPRPNIVIFYLDDMGWIQPGCYGGKLAPTPNIDAIAAAGIRFTDGYVSACICSPSRVGLMTGRYQARSGHDSNTTRRAGSELSLQESTMAQDFKALGYTTAITGKWHLGSSPKHLPAARGFDVSMGTVSNLGEGAFYRGLEVAETLEGAPVTSPVYAREAVRFLDAHHRRPFLLYVPLNAVHAPHAASPAWLAKFAHLDNRRRAYAAMIAEADEAVGTVMARLRALKLEENTLVFCIGDNGGASPEAEMGGLRGRKWTLWEGGIRVPYLAQWKGRIPAGRVSAEPVIQLDVLATALAAAGGRPHDGRTLDGVNLLPLLEGRARTLGRPALYWRYGPQWAIRQGPWKLVRVAPEGKPALHDLSTDPGEQRDLAAEQPERVRQLQALYDRWNSQMPPPRWVDERWNQGEERGAGRKRKKA